MKLVSSVHHCYILWHFQPISFQVGIDPLTVMLGHIRSTYKGFLGVWLVCIINWMALDIYTFYSYICGIQKPAIQLPQSLTVLLDVFTFNVQIFK